MFKKFKRTKIAFGAAAVSAMVAFPVTASVVNSQRTQNFGRNGALSSTAVAAIADTFTNDDGKLISTPDTVITVDKLSTDQFAKREDAAKLLIDTPKILDKYVAGAEAAFDKSAEEARLKAGLSALSGSYNSSDKAFSTFLEETKKEKLYKDLNPEMDQHAQAGTRFNYMVPSNIVDITNYISGTPATLGKSTSFGVPTTSKPFVYKIATIDTSKITADQTLALDYMYSDGGRERKFQIVIPTSQDIIDNDDTTSLKELVDKNEIFVRSLDQADRTDSPDITNPISFDNSGLTIVKDADGLSLFTSLQSINAKSSVMIDTKTTTKDAKLAATVGVLGSSTQAIDSSSLTLNMNELNGKADNKITDLSEHTITNDWTTNDAYSWSGGGASTQADQITFYMKKGTSMDDIETDYFPAASDPKNQKVVTKISIEAGETGVVLKPKDSIKISDGYNASDKTFELASSVKGDFYKITLSVEKGAHHPFLVGPNDDQYELKWDLPTISKQKAIFFEDPTDKTVAWPNQTIKTVKLEREINDDATEQEVYRDVYGSWVKPFESQLGVKQNIVSALNQKLGVVGGNNIWKDFKYYRPKANVLDYTLDKNLESQTIPVTSSMGDIITILNEYHNSLVGIISANGLSVEDNNKENSYKPKSQTDFDVLLSNYIKKAVGGDVTDAISKKIALADKILGLKSYDDYETELAIWKANPNHDAIKTNFPDIYTALSDIQKDMPDEFDLMTSTVSPDMGDTKDPEHTKSGIISIAQYVQKDIEAMIPNLFENELKNFKNKMAGIKGKKFAQFLSSNFDTKILDPSTIQLGKTKVSGIQFADIVSAAKTTATHSGKEFIKELATLLYKTGIYRTVFAANPRLRETFVKLYEADPENSVLWAEDTFDKASGVVADALNIDSLMMTYQGSDTFDAAIGVPNSPTGDKLFITELQKLATAEAATFTSESDDVEFRWSAGNVYMGTTLQRDVILANINNVVDFLRNNDKAKVLGDRLENFIKTFTETEQSASAIAQLGPKLGRYKLDSFIPGFSNDPAKTEEIVEQMVHVDPIKVLLPNTGKSKAFKALEKSGSAATLGLVVAAGALIFSLGGILIGLSFTKRIVVGGKTWSVKLIILRVALLIIAIAGIYMVLTGTVLSGHEALTTIVNV